MNVEIGAIIQSQEIKDALAKLSAKPKIGSPQGFAAFMAAETEKSTAVANSANVKVDEAALKMLSVQRLGLEFTNCVVAPRL